MKIFGLEFKFNGFDVFHKGNFNPDAKADTSTLNAHLSDNLSQFSKVNTDILNTQLSLMKETFALKASQSAGVQQLVNMAIDSLNDSSGINTGASSGYTYDSTNKCIKALSTTISSNVINAVYITSATARPQVLSNGWIVIAVANSTTSIIFYVSKDNGSTWSVLTTWTTTVNSFSICSYGNNVYAIAINSSGTTIPLVKFNATTVGSTVTSSINIDSSQSSFGSGCYIAVDSNGYLHATWCSKNTTYPNSFNVRYSKSTDGGTNWATPTQVTNQNVLNTNFSNTCLVLQNSNIIIMHETKVDSISSIECRRFNGSTWSGVNIFGGTSYQQFNPSAVVTSDGTIHVVWSGSDSTNSAARIIKYSKSTDGGTTWATVTNLLSGISYHQDGACITCNSSNDLYVYFNGVDSAITTSYNQVRFMKQTSGVWSTVTNITANTTSGAQGVSVCDNYKNFTSPLVVYQDTQATAVKFIATFSGGIIAITKNTLALSKKYNRAYVSAKVVLNGGTATFKVSDGVIDITAPIDTIVDTSAFTTTNLILKYTLTGNAQVFADAIGWKDV